MSKQKENKNTTQETNARKPVKTLRSGHISCSVWENTTEKGRFYSVKIVRTYKDGEEWKESASFNRDDLLVVAKLAQSAFDFCCLEEQAQNG